MALFENVFDSTEQWEVDPVMDSKFIDGVEFVRAKKPGTQSRYFWLRKEALKPSKPKSIFKNTA